MRIRAIAERAGIPAMTLRSWERRYGFPHPQRTSSGYRSYSDEDLRQVMAVKALVNEGTVVSDAIQQVRSAMVPDTRALLDQLFEAAQDMSELELERIVGVAEQTMETRAFCHAFALPALRKASDVLDVAREHLASSVIRAHLRRSIERIKPAPRGKPVVLACPAGEEHEGGLLAIAVELRLRGIRTLLLGANTPAEAIGIAVKRSKARGVGLSLVGKRTDKQLSDIVARVVAASHSVPVVVGGAAARRRLKLIFEAGALYAESADELLASL